MNKDQIKHLYEKCKEQWNGLGKELLIDEERIMKFCEYSDALTCILEQNNMSVDTNHGGPVYNTEENAVFINLVSNGDPNNIIGQIIMGYNGISVKYIDRKEALEAYSHIVYNGDYTSGAISKVIDDSNMVVELNKEAYTIDGQSYSYASNTEVGKIIETNNALKIASKKNDIVFKR